MSSPWSLHRRDTGRVLLEELELATTFWRRFVGLQFRKSLPEGRGVLLGPCNSIHTCFCRFPLDVAFVSAEGVVLSVRLGLRPWRIVPPVKEARCVLEAAAGQISLQAGDRLMLAGGSPTMLPRPLREFPVRSDGGKW